MKKHKGKRLWKTDTESPSGAEEMIYGIELPKAVKDNYEKHNLNEGECEEPCDCSYCRFRTKKMKPSI